MPGTAKEEKTLVNAIINKNNKTMDTTETILKIYTPIYWRTMKNKLLHIELLKLKEEETNTLNRPITHNKIDGVKIPTNLRETQDQ